MNKDKQNQSECEKCEECTHCMYPSCPCHTQAPKINQDLLPSKKQLEAGGGENSKRWANLYAPQEDRELLEKAAEDFNNRFTGVMKELAEEDQKKDSWEDIKNDYSQSGLFDNIYDEKELDERVNNLIQKAREQTIAEIAEKIEGMKKEMGYNRMAGNIRDEDSVGYTQALEDLKTLLKQKIN